ncbi:MAG: type II secretion system protein [Candidatus Omnitrophota bacterium]|nr:type II secretion system protein [Candidatus Omnitrophota bacterium]
MVNKLKANSGFTLIETVVVLGIFSVIVGGLYSTLLAGKKVWSENESQAIAQRSVRQTLAVMTGDLRVAQYINLTQSSSSVAVDFFHPVAGPITYSWATTGANANKIIRTTDTGSQILGQYISQLSFNDNTNYVLVNIQASVPTDQGDSVEYDLVKKIAKR